MAHPELQDKPAREERRILLALGFLATALVYRQSATGYFFYINKALFIDYLLVLPWIIYGLFMMFYLSDDIFGERLRRWFHFMGLMTLTFQIWLVIFVFGVTALALYSTPEIIAFFTLVISGFLTISFKKIVSAEWPGPRPRRSRAKVAKLSP